jgi:hypothetical protein
MRRRPTGRPARPIEPADVQLAYDPHPDGKPDPGEVVWAWIPYEDDPTRGKDRPGREGATLDRAVFDRIVAALS